MTTDFAALTEERTDAMLPGREMDALVHQLVMGFRRTERDGQVWYDRMLYDEQLSMERLQFGQSVPPYSTDIAAAWQVLERFNSFELNHYAKHTINKYRVPAYECRVMRYKPEGTGRAYGDTAPLAICRAALKAVSNAG